MVSGKAGDGPFVSVVVATRDRPQSLRLTLEAIARQRHADYELVLVDDGSAPDAAAANRRHAEGLFRHTQYVYLPRAGASGRGPSWVRNRGIDAGRGELLAFCDDDDVWTDEQHLAAAVTLFREDPELDLTFANQEDRVGERVVTAVRLPALIASLARGARETGRAFPLTRRQCLLEYFPHVNTTVVRRGLVQAVGGFWESARYLEDCDFYVRCVAGARGIVYRDRTVASHDVPDAAQRSSASTALSELERTHAEAEVAQHLLRCCEDAAAVDYAGRLAGNAYRNLATAAGRRGAWQTAAAYAGFALAARFSWKWAAYATYCRMKAWGIH
jgi:GT2 family glycosyltransferase